MSIQSIRPAPLDRRSPPRGATLRSIILGGTAAVILLAVAFGAIQYYRHHTPETFTAKARIALDHHDPQVAIRYLRKARAGGPNRVMLMQIRQLMATALIDTNRSAAARAYLMKALAANPKDMEAQRILRRTYTHPVYHLVRTVPKPVMAPDAEKILAACDKQLGAIKRLPGRWRRSPQMLIADGLLNHEYYYVYEHQRQTALAELKHAREAGDQAASARARRDLRPWKADIAAREKSALSQFDKAIAMDPKTRFAVLCMEQALHNDHRYHAAAEVGRKAIAEHDENAGIVVQTIQDEVADRKHTPRRADRLAKAYALAESYHKSHPKDIAVAAELGAVALQQRHYSRAEAIAQEILRLSPGDINATMLLAQCKLITGHAKTAHHLANQLAAKIGSMPAPWFLLGRADDSLGRHRRAAHDYRKALGIDPQYVNARRSLLLSYVAAGENTQAVQLAATIRRIDPGFMPAWIVTLRNRQQHHASTADLRAALIKLSRDPDLPMHDRPELARVLVALHANRRAARLLASLPKNMSTSADSVHARALLAKNAGHMGAAISLLRKAVKAGPKQFSWRLQLADLYAQDNRAQDAIAAYGKAAKLANDYAQYIALAQAYLTLRLPNRGLAEANKAVALRPHGSDALTAKRDALIMLGRPAPAPQVATGVIRNAADAEKFARIDLEANAPAAALSATQRGLAIAPRDVVLELLRARALAAMNKRAQAGHALLTILRARPHSVRAFLNAAQIFVRPKLSATGMRWAATAARYDAPQAAWVKGQLLGVARHFRKARAAFSAGLAKTGHAEPVGTRRRLFTGLLNTAISLHDQSGYLKTIHRMTTIKSLEITGRLMAADYFNATGQRALAAKELKALGAKINMKSLPGPAVASIAQRWAAAGRTGHAMRLLQGDKAQRNNPAIIAEEINLEQVGGHMRKALALLLTLQKDNPKNPSVLASVAMYQAQQRQFPQAFASLKSCAKLGAAGRLIATTAKAKLYSMLGLADAAAKTLNDYSRMTLRDDYDADVSLGELWSQLKNYSAAQAMLRRIPPYARQYVQARVLLAQCQFATHQTTEALRTIQTLVRQAAAQNPSLRFVQFGALLQAGQPGKAYDLAMGQRKAILPGTLPWVQWTLQAANAARQAGRYNQAAAVLAGLSKTPDRAMAAADIAMLQLIQGNKAAATAALAKIPASAFKGNAGLMVIRLLAASGGSRAGVVRQANAMPGHANGALLFATLAAAPPEQWSADIGKRIGNGSLAARDLTPLISSLQKSRSPAQAMWLLALAQELRQIGWPRASLRVLTELQKIAPDCPQGLEIRYAAEKTLHRDAAAKSTASKLISTYPDLSATELLLVRRDFADGNYADALTRIKAVLKFAPRDGQLINMEAAAYKRSGNVRKAISIDRALLKTNPKAASPANNLAYALAQAYPTNPSMLAQANEQINAALKRRPGNPAYLDTKGYVELLSGHAKRAYKALSAAIVPLRLLPAVQYHMGLVYAKMGHRHLASLHLRNAVALAGKTHANIKTEASAALRGL